MAEPGRKHFRGDEDKDINIQFNKGQYWKAAPNSLNLTVLGNAVPNPTGGCKMSKGYQRILANSVGQDTHKQAYGRRTSLQDSKVNKMCAWDLGNEHIMITYPDAYKIGIWRRVGQTGNYATFTQYRFNEDSTGGTINEWGPDPLRWAKKSQCTEIGGWIVHGRPSKDMIYGVVGKIKPAFTVGLANDKGNVKDFYDPGRILPMVEAGYYTDDDSPKLSFHGVPVPLASGQHKEMPWGAPFGQADFWLSDASDATDGHGMVDTGTPDGLEHNTFTESHGNNYCVTDQLPNATQRFIVAMENNLDETAPHAHIFTGSAQTTDKTANKLFWHVKSQEGGIDQEYSTGRHFCSSNEVLNIDDTRTEANSGQDTESGKIINWSLPHPFSVDFDDVGNAYMAYWVVDNASTPSSKLIMRKYIKGSFHATDGIYTSARIADNEGIHYAGGTTDCAHDIADVDIGQTKCIYDSDNDTMWTVFTRDSGAGGSHAGSTGNIHIIKCTGTWDASNQPTVTQVRVGQVPSGDEIKGFCMDLAEIGNRKYLFVLVDSINDGGGDERKNPSIIYIPVDATADSTIQDLTPLGSADGWEMACARGIPTMMRMFKHKGETKMGVLATVYDTNDNNYVKQFAWVGTFNGNNDDKTLDTWDSKGYAPAKGEGWMYEDKGDVSKHNFTEYIVRSDDPEQTDHDMWNYGYHGDTQGRLHHKEPSLNRWVVRKDATEATDSENYLGRITFNYESEKWDVFDPTTGGDINSNAKGKNYSEQIGCRPGCVGGDVNLALPTRLGPFLKDSSNFDAREADGGAGTNAPTVFFPTTWNGNCILAYPCYHMDGDGARTIHAVTDAKRLSLAYHGTIYGSSNDAGHPYLKGTTEGEGSAKPGIGERPYPSNNMWTGANMNPLTPITTFTEDMPKTATGKKPMLFGMDVNLIERITTEGGNIKPGRYRYKFAFAKSGAGEEYRNTGAEGNILVHNSMDAYVELDLTEAGGNKSVRLQLNKPMLEGKAVFDFAHSSSSHGDDTVDSDHANHYLIVEMGPEKSGSGALGSRQIGDSVSDGSNGFYTHLDQWSPDNVLTNPYVKKTSVSMNNTSKFCAHSSSNVTYIDVGYVMSGKGSGNMGAQNREGGTYDNWRLHLMDTQTGDDFDMENNVIGASHVLGRSLCQGAPTNYQGGGLMHWGPLMDKTRPYLRYVIIYRTGDLEKAGTDREAYFKVGEIDLVDDVDWSDHTIPLSFLDNTANRDLSSKEGPIDHAMIPVDGNNITAMAASGNNLWVAFNDTNSSNIHKSNIPSTLIRTHEHWEYFNPADVVVVDDNLIIHALKDFEGALWIFSNKGSYVVPNPHEKTIYMKKKDNFIIHSHEDDSSRFVRVGGAIFILGQDGLYLHDPNPHAGTNFKKLSTPVDDFFKEGGKVPMGIIHDEESESIICWTKEALENPRQVHHSTTSSKTIYTCNYHLPTRSWWSHMEYGGGTGDGYSNYFDDMIALSRTGVDDIAEVSTTINNSIDSELIYKNRKGYFTPMTTSTGTPNYTSGEVSSYGFQYIKIDDEIIKVTSMDGNKFYTMVREQYGTSAAEHTAGALIKNYRKWDTEGSGPLLFGITSGLSGTIPTSGIVRLGNKYVNGTQDLYLQTNWIGNPGEERHWDKLEIEYEPPIYKDASNPGNDIVIKIEWDIDTLNPWAKDSDDTRTNASHGNATPRSLSQEYDASNSYANYKEITTAQYENVGNAITLIDSIPVKIKAEMIRVRFRLSITGDSNNKDIDCTDIVLRGIGFKTRYVGRDRYK